MKNEKEKKSGGVGGRQPPEVGATAASRAGGARGGPPSLSKLQNVLLRPLIETGRYKVLLQPLIETRWPLGILGFSMILLENSTPQTMNKKLLNKKSRL